VSELGFKVKTLSELGLVGFKGL